MRFRLSVEPRSWISGFFLCASLAAPGFAWAEDGLWEQSKALWNRLSARWIEATSADLPSQPVIIDGMKEALRIASRRAIDRLSRRNGFYRDQTVHIQLPTELRKGAGLAKALGVGTQFKDLEYRLNGAAELATFRAESVFSAAIERWQLEDPSVIYFGAEDAATRQFQRNMAASLGQAFRPIFEDALVEARAHMSFEELIRTYPDLARDANEREELREAMVTQGVARTLAGIFYYMAIEESEIRRNPERRTSALLRELFGA
ncbi:MAG: DUF4197 domain-containing protein [Alphaproteobacteria bacterium]|nr:DUF4197 domain-containing protein [Alphaproteobacteria bacterium]